MVPMLDEAIELAAANGANHVVIGMAHRGRLNVLAHTVGRPGGRDPARVRGRARARGRHRRPRERLGRRQVPPRRRGDRERPSSGDVTVTLTSNPSHLEYVDPVVEGEVRAVPDGPRHRPSRRPRPRPGARRPHPRRRRLPRPGSRRRDAQPRRRSPATRPAARCTSSPTTRSASRPTRTRAARRATRPISPRASTRRSST